MIAIIQLCSSQNIEFNEGGYILAPSNLIEGKKSDAKWIWDSGEPNPKNYFYTYEENLALTTMLKATAFISAFSFAELYVNGIYVDRIPTNPDPEYQTYEKIDLALT